MSSVWFAGFSCCGPCLNCLNSTSTKTKTARVASSIAPANYSHQQLTEFKSKIAAAPDYRDFSTLQYRGMPQGMIRWQSEVFHHRIFAQCFSSEALATSMTFLMSTSSDSSLFFMPSEAYFLRAASTSLRVWLKASLLSKPKRPAASQQAMTACSYRLNSAKQITYSIATLWSHQAPSRRHALAAYTFLLARQTCPASASSPQLLKISATSLANSNCFDLLFSDASSFAKSCRASLGLANFMSFFLKASCSSTSTGGGSAKLVRMNSIASSQNSLRQLPLSANASFLKTSPFTPSENSSAKDQQWPYSQNSLKSYTFLNYSPSKMVWKAAASSFSKRPSFGMASISSYKLEGVTVEN